MLVVTFQGVTFSLHGIISDVVLQGWSGLFPFIYISVSISHVEAHLTGPAVRVRSSHTRLMCRCVRDRYHLAVAAPLMCWNGKLPVHFVLCPLHTLHTDAANCYCVRCAFVRERGTVGKNSCKGRPCTIGKMPDFQLLWLRLW